mgnify:CR=1 FL=1
MVLICLSVFLLQVLLCAVLVAYTIFLLRRYCFFRHPGAITMIGRTAPDQWWVAHGDNEAVRVTIHIDSIVTRSMLFIRADSLDAQQTFLPLLVFPDSLNQATHRALRAALLEK